MLKDPFPRFLKSDLAQAYTKSHNQAAAAEKAKRGYSSPRGTVYNNSIWERTEYGYVLFETQKMI